MSQDGLDLQSTVFSSISNKFHDAPIRFRARLHHSRPVGSKIVFLILRQDSSTFQGVLTEEEGVVSHNMVRWAESLHHESIVYVQGKIQIPQDGQSQVKATTIHEVEVKIEKVRSKSPLIRYYHVLTYQNSFTSLQLLPPSFHFKSMMPVAHLWSWQRAMRIFIISIKVLASPTVFLIYELLSPTPCSVSAQE
jgi:aspartyl/asparaginyl-tRNA synthetase